MGYRVDFEFSPLYELMNSLELFLTKKSIKNVELGPEWVNAVQEILDEHKVDLGNPKNLPCFNYLSLLIWQSPVKDDVEAFVKWLRSLDPGQLYERLFSYYSEVLPADLSSLRDKYIDLISVWNSVYFNGIDPIIIQTLRQSFNEWDGKEKGVDPVTFVDQVSGGVRIEDYKGLQQVILIPSYHINPLITIYKYKNMAHVMYPVDLPEKDSNQPSKKLVRLTKALSDENRLRILKLVKEGPKTFTEIQQHFELSKSTIHHHVMMLRTAGLISAYHTNECCTETFVYRESGLTELTQNINMYLGK